MLGRGYYTGPAKTLQALKEFLGARLLPQDRVAILALNRGTDFTTDHESLRAVVERFRTRHERIETQLREYFLRNGLYGAKDIPQFLQADIDAIFAGAAGHRPERSLRARSPMRSRSARTSVVQAAELQRAETLATRTGDFTSLPDSAATNTASRMDVAFDQYIAQQIELLHDVSNLYAGIDYLRYLEGEKHLVFLTPDGVALPRLENDKSLAAAASDARVALDLIYGGGAAPDPPPSRVLPDGTLVPPPALRSASSMFQQSAMVSDMRVMSEMTGGQMTAFRSGEYAFSRLDRATRFEYLLGYSPSSAATDGAFRKIAITVKRPGATVLYRQGYYATPQLVPLDRRQFITFNRLTVAARHAGTIDDITVTLNPPTLQGEGTSLNVLVEGNIRSPRINFTDTNGFYAASLDIAVYAGNGKEQPVGEMLRRVDLKLKADVYRAFGAQGASFDIRVPIRERPKYVKVIVYDYAADLLGSATATLK